MITKTLQSRTEVAIRFSEVDSLRIVWHGNYIKYFEDGRHDFGKTYGLSYHNIYDKGYVAPLVKVNCDYKKPLFYGDTAIVETTFIDSPAAKLIFDYKIYNKASQELVTTGQTIQVFLHLDQRLSLNIPDFFAEWKNQWLYAT